MQPDDVDGGSPPRSRRVIGVVLAAVTIIAIAACAVSPVWIGNISALAVLVAYCITSRAVTGMKGMHVMGWIYALLLVVAVARYHGVDFVEQLWYISCGIT